MHQCLAHLQGVALIGQPHVGRTVAALRQARPNGDRTRPLLGQVPQHILIGLCTADQGRLHSSRQRPQEAWLGRYLQPEGRVVQHLGRVIYRQQAQV